jgi:protein-disulfide isomerase
MMKITRALALFAVFLIAGTAAAETPAGNQAPVFSDAQKDAIHQIIRDYLVANPEVLLEVNDELQKKVQLKMAERRKPFLKQLYSSAPANAIGTGKVTVVEFFDYNCSVCRHAFNDIQKLRDSDKDVRILLIEMPIFEDSAPVVKASLAVAKLQPAKYFDFHRMMINHKGRLTEADALRLAKDLGIDVDQLKKEMASPEIEKKMEENLRLAEALGVNGTPAFFVGDINIPGAPEGQQLFESVAAARKSCTVC